MTWPALSRGVPELHNRRSSTDPPDSCGPGGRPRVVFGFTIAGGKIVAIDMVADPERLCQLDLVLLDE